MKVAQRGTDASCCCSTSICRAVGVTLVGMVVVAAPPGGICKCAVRTQWQNPFAERATTSYTCTESRMLHGLAHSPKHYGNAMLVLDLRRQESAQNHLLCPWSSLCSCAPAHPGAAGTSSPKDDSRTHARARTQHSEPRCRMITSMSD